MDWVVELLQSGLFVIVKEAKTSNRVLSAPYCFAAQRQATLPELAGRAHVHIHRYRDTLLSWSISRWSIHFEQRHEDVETRMQLLSGSDVSELCKQE